MKKRINPFDHGALHTDMWKTEGLKQALDKYGFDTAFGGAHMRKKVVLKYSNLMQINNKSYISCS